MPQATPELRAKFPEWDGEALDVIRQNFTVDQGGVIRKKDPKYEPTEREWDAVDYLFQEWDYAYEAHSTTC